MPNETAIRWPTSESLLRIIRQLVTVHHPAQPMSAAATKLVEILAEELAAAARQLQQHLIIGPD